MIFVTVGTHEQQFDRLVKYMDEWAASHEEKIVMQTGYCTYEPINCSWEKFFSFQDMNRLVRDARIVITHGGPSSFIMALQFGKIPIVVPRQKKYGEHVNDHQLEFCKTVTEKQKNILVIEKINELGKTITDYEKIIDEMDDNKPNHNAEFCKKFVFLVDDLFGDNE